MPIIRNNEVCITSNGTINKLVIIRIESDKFPSDKDFDFCRLGEFQQKIPYVICNGCVGFGT